jgi:hypothetical protein
MHLNVFNEQQHQLLPFLSSFKKEFYMVGGTAIALHIGHRRSIDFDLFKNGNIHSKKIVKKFQENNEEPLVTLNRSGQLNLVCRGVKFTFFDFGYDIPHPIVIGNGMTIPGLPELAAMKAFALGMRSKWKDYIDLYFILKDRHSIPEISAKAKGFFGDMFSEKLFRAQLNYFQGISFEEAVEFMPGFEVSEAEVKAFLVDAALTGF